MRTASWTRALVTGGTRGIGRAFVDLLGHQNTDLVVVARDDERLRATRSEVRHSAGVTVEIVAADLRRHDELEIVADRLGADPAIDLLVNNAGGGRLGPFIEREWSSLREEIELNVTATLRLTHAAIGPMAERGGGTVINVAAGNAFYPTPLAATYSAAKALVTSFSEAVDYEARGTGVNVTVICPGFTRTDAQAFAGIDRSRVPAALWAEPETVAETALRAARRHRAVVSPGPLNRAAALFGRHLPRRVLLPAIAPSQRRIRV